MQTGYWKFTSWFGFGKAKYLKYDGHNYELVSNVEHATEWNTDEDAEIAVSDRLSLFANVFYKIEAVTKALD